MIGKTAPCRKVPLKVENKTPLVVEMERLFNVSIKC
jgi:hypothetical protein